MLFSLPKFREKNKQILWSPNYQSQKRVLFLQTKPMKLYTLLRGKSINYNAHFPLEGASYLSEEILKRWFKNSAKVLQDNLLSVLPVHTAYLLKLKLFFIVVNVFTKANTKVKLHSNTEWISCEYCPDMNFNIRSS